MKTSKRVALDVGERTLANGLTVLAIRNPGVSTFAARVALDVGQLDEGPAEFGAAYLTGSCLDEGTKRYDTVQLAQAVEDIGGSLHGYADGGWIQCPAEERNKAVRLLREMVVEPTFPSREVKRVLQETLAEIEHDDEEPRMVGARQFRAEVYGDHPFGRPPYGDAERVRATKASDLRRFHSRWFAPTRGYVAVAGPAEVEESLDLVSRVFRSFRGTAPDHVEHAPPPLPEARRDVHLPMDREQVHVFVGHPGIRRTDPDYYALQVLDHVLGSGPGFTARITKSLRDELGLCYTVHAGMTSSAGIEPGMFRAYIGTSPKHVKRAINGFLAEMKRLRDEPPTAEEVADVQAYLTGSFVFGLERNSSLVDYAIRVKRFELGFDLIERYPQWIRDVTPERVREVAERHLHPDRVVVVTAGAG